MAGEADELARALDEHAHVTGEYVRVEQGIYAALSPARTRRGWRLSLAVLSVLVLAAPLGVFVGRAHFVPAAMICPNAANTPGGADGFGGCWPYEGNTGIPAGTTLTDYTGSCTVTAANLVIDSETVNCGLLEIRAANVQISKSLLNGRVFIDPDNFPSASFTITDSRVMGGDALDESGIGNAHFVATRVDVTGGHRSVWCDGDCSVIDSYLHGQETDYTGVEHDGAIRMGDGATIRHNVLWCEALTVEPDAGCSADLTGYGDFAPIRNNTLERNLFHATEGAACAFGGSSGDDGSKPYGNQAENIVFVDNVFQRGPTNLCAAFFPITDFDETRPGNQWINNRWDDGGIVPPEN